MNINDPRYANQGLHVVLALFTVVNAKFKVLLIKRKNEPFKNKWILVGGCAYNTEAADTAMKREIFEKTNFNDIKFNMFDVFTDPNRSPLKRMIAIGYIGVADASIIEKFRENNKASEADWFEIDKVPELGYDHKQILTKAIEVLKEKIFDSTIIKTLYPKEFTLNELQSTYEKILNKQLDRRNFRKKMLQSGLITETNYTMKKDKTKPSKLYKFTEKEQKFNLYK